MQRGPPCRLNHHGIMVVCKEKPHQIGVLLSSHRTEEVPYLRAVSTQSQPNNKVCPPPDKQALCHCAFVPVDWAAITAEYTCV